jgi:low temperature requirement protein LtrA
MYFDVVAAVSARRLARTTAGRERNAMARDSYSYLHFHMVAGIILVALAMKKTLGHVGDSLELVPAFALLGGVAAYLIGHVAFRFRHIHTVNRHRLFLALALLAVFPAATLVPALAAVAIVDTLLWLTIAYETRLYGERRAQVRSPA